MPKGLIEGLLTFLGILFFFVLPMIARARGAASAAGSWGAYVPRRPACPGRLRRRSRRKSPSPRPRPPPFRSRPAVTLPPEPPTIVQPRAPTPAAPLAAPGGLARLRRLTPWQRAVVWAEILGPPRGLQ